MAKRCKQREAQEPMFTRTEWNEIQSFRIARMIESGETIPTLEELLTAMREVASEKNQ